MHVFSGQQKYVDKIICFYALYDFLWVCNDLSDFVLKPKWENFKIADFLWVLNVMFSFPYFPGTSNLTTYYWMNTVSEHCFLSESNS